MIKAGTETPALLTLRNLQKRFGETVAVAGVSLEVRVGQIVGMIGPDGAGKTTTMRLALGLLLPESGDVQVAGQPIERWTGTIKQRFGYMPQRFSLYPDLTVAENLRFFADLYLVPPGERSKIEQRLLRFSRLDPFHRRLAGALSGGMKQKLALSCNLIHTPEILVLDEPTTGVDPVSRQEFWTYLHELAGEGLAMLISTPYMDEAELCDRILLMHHGRIIAEGTPQHVRSLFTRPLLEVRAPDTASLRQQLLALDLGDVQVLRFGDSLHVVLDDDNQEAVLRHHLERLNATCARIDPSIEDVFVALMKELEATAP
jgi:ABC-2 type transport system ATP-binding protein